MAATTASQLMRHDVYHLPGGCPSYVAGRVVIIGDAAHAMLPTIGQGAATALEDGVCVGRMIAAPVSAGGSLAAALAAFDQARRPRCRRLARQAILLARCGFELGDGWRQPARNTLLRLIPTGPAFRAGTRITRWAPPGQRARPGHCGLGLTSRAVTGSPAGPRVPGRSRGVSRPAPLRPLQACPGSVKLIRGAPFSIRKAA